MSDAEEALKYMYVDVGTVRIQRYLSRTALLKGRRGASAALAEATRIGPDHELVRSLPGVRVNTEAGEVDGVVSLVAPAGSADPEQICGKVFAHLRAKLPAAELQAVWGEGATYLDAYHSQLSPRRASGEARWDLPPAPEFPYAATCRVCDLDPATARVTVQEDDTRAACADCHMRYKREVRQAGKGAEQDLAEALGLERVEHLEALARLGDKASGRNHLVTCSIDGNGFGEFFRILADPQNRVSVDAKTKVSRELNEHTRGALTEAVRAVQRPSDGGTLCAVPHVVGGDDVLVTLPADRGWRFVRTYLSRFAHLVEATRQQVDPKGKLELPQLTASAGLVFARFKHPFHSVVEAAEEQLRAAKSAVRGTTSSVAHHDVTTGESGAPVKVKTLDAAEDFLTQLADTPKSFRSGLAAELRRSGADTDLAKERVRNTAKRLCRADLVEPFLEGGDAAPSLEQALRIVRWWR